MTNVVISQPMFFPWRGFFEQLALADVYIYLDDAQFSKGSFTNRVRIKRGAALEWLTVALADKGTFTPINQLRAAHPDWRNQHRAQVQRALAGAKHLDRAIGLMDAAHRHENLCDALIESSEVIAAHLKIGANRQVLRSSEMQSAGSSWRRVLDQVKSVGGTHYITGHGAAHYLDHEAFEKEGVSVSYMDYDLSPYPQGLGEFSPYVSILDLIARHNQPLEKLRSQILPWRSFMALKGYG
ncbi:MAG: WbqC family protein [Hyphomicrobiales bacterium]|nr:WbqC family protein [Hyphomicrobiales bacterium]